MPLVESDNRLPHEKTVEELLSELEANPSTEEEVKNTQLNDILSFVGFFNIKSGKERVPNKFLWKLYQAWSKEPVSRQKFGKEISIYLPRYKECFEIDRGVFNLSNEAFEYLNKDAWVKTKQPTFQRHFNNFLSRFDLSTGESWTEFQILFYLYDKWTYKNRTRRPLSKIRFKEFCDLTFKEKKVTADNVVWYRVSDLSAHISQQEIEEIREGIRFSGKEKSKKQK